MPASLELVKIALQAYGNGDCEIALALADPLIRWDERASRPDGDLVWKHEDVQRAMRRYLDSWESYRFDVEDLAEVGPGKVVAICRERGKPKEGVEVDRRFGGLWVVDQGKIVSWVTYPTPREAVRAAKELLGGTLDKSQVKRSTGPTGTRAAATVPVAPSPAPEQTPAEASDGERPRKRALTISEEQKRAARARAKLRRRASRQSA
jgi:ketosteroid isomerase-like protein